MDCLDRPPWCSRERSGVADRAAKLRPRLSVVGTQNYACPRLVLRIKRLHSRRNVDAIYFERRISSAWFDLNPSAGPRQVHARHFIVVDEVLAPVAWQRAVFAC